MSVSEVYGGLVSAEQIGSANGIDEEHPLASGQSLVIPLPCTCFNNSNNGAASVYMSYVVQSGDELTRIAAEYGVTIGNLEINGLGQTQIDPGDILAIPPSDCSSANLNWYNESLIVPNGSYALTANNCIKCGCRPTDLSLVNSTDIKCLGKESEGAGSPMESPAINYTAPYFSPSPLSPPQYSHSAKSHSLGLLNSSPAHRHGQKSLSQALHFIILLVFELIFEIILVKRLSWRKRIIMKILLTPIV